MPGPCQPVTRPIVVSVTEYRAHHRLDLPGVALKGLRMRLGWYAMPGALGLWLWSLPAAMRGGSISVWDNEDSLERFINLPHHIDIMDRYRTRGTVRSDHWSMVRFQPDIILQRALDWICEESTCAQ
ncbi:hypothetical protein [uncultured Mycobacterium sp.]|uniref:hypothetical protein n=1 Tax=uncultured Mycobacterium sp. TaxID=171292 RepID=UPI0035CA5FDF